jgi:Concanavalin A-like lectin/glucanases superfamily
MYRNLSRIAMSVVAACWVGGLGACGTDEVDDQAALQALLHDKALQQVPPSAAVRPAVGAASRVAVAPAAGLTTDPPIGAWNFDDCSPFQTQLNDSTFFFNTAFRSVNVACVQGIAGQGVAIAATEDIVYVPDQPSFTFEQGVTVAGWFKPTTTTGTKTLIRKRDRDTSSFALLLSGGKFQFVASFGNGRAASVTALTKAKVGVFQHVAATYDGATLRLYLDGAEVTNLDVAGTIPIGGGPLLMGNDGSERRFNGVIDGVTFATHALDPDEVLQLTCNAAPTVVVTPTQIPATAVGVPVPIDVALTNHSRAACAPITFSLITFPSGLVLDPPPFLPLSSAPVASGETGHLTVTATAPDSADPGQMLSLQFQVSEQTSGFFDFHSIPFQVADSMSGCQVKTTRELMITALSVVDDPVRTVFDGASSDPRNGAWTFKRLMENMAPSAADAPAMVEAVMTSFTTPQTVNGFTVQARPGMQAQILSSWPRTPDGQLDLAQPPLQLQAIVNRFDLRNLANGDAGEGRFVFAFVAPGNVPLQATLIMEYKLPAATDQDVLDWANSFHALGALAAGEDYNAALQAITDRFTGRGARPSHQNGSAINAVRTNEIAFAGNGLWEMRQFGLATATGRLAPVTVDLTPDRSFDGGATLASYINANQAEIIAETHTVPAVFNGQPFEAGAIFNDLSTWIVPGVDPSARHHFALNTCNGCHSAQETNTIFLQISPRFPGSEATLSGFLTGTTVSDPVTGQSRTFNDLGRRKLDLAGIVCPVGSMGPSPTALRKGISRVH